MRTARDASTRRDMDSFPSQGGHGAHASQLLAGRFILAAGQASGEKRLRGPSGANHSEANSMRRAETICSVLTSLIALSSVAALGGQTPLGKDASDLRAHLGLQALDRYLETWN